MTRPGASTAPVPNERKVVVSAGALVWRERAGRLEVALVHRPRYKDWSWPKGKLDPGESVPAAAAREVAEETGEAVVLGSPLPGINYRLSDGRRKHVYYWAARLADDDAAVAVAARAPVAPAGRDEIDEVVWVGASTAAEMLTRDNDRLPLERAVHLWERGRLDTRVTVIARHGRAQRRSAWKGGEETRPLTGQGRAQAAALVPILAAFGVREVLTSPWERCLSTVTPYAERAGAPLRTEDALTERAYEEDPQQAEKVVEAMLAQPADAVLSTHRPVLQAVMDTVNEASRKWTTGSLPEHDPWLRTGEALVAHVAGSGDNARVVAVERHRAGSVGA